MARKKVAGTASTMPIGILAGVIMGISTITLGSLLATYMIYSGKIGERTLGYVLMGVILLSALLGAWISIIKVKRRRLLVGMLTGVSIFLMLLGVNGVFLGGYFEGVPATGSMVLLGCMMAFLITTKSGKGRRRSRR